MLPDCRGLRPDECSLEPRDDLEGDGAGVCAGAGGGTTGSAPAPEGASTGGRSDSEPVGTPAASNSAVRLVRGDITGGAPASISPARMSPGEAVSAHGASCTPDCAAAEFSTVSSALS